MTEDEAKKKWCPFARAPWLNGDGPYGVVAVNRQATGVRPKNLGAPEEPKCLGSECMAWRWLLPPKETEENKRMKHSDIIDILPTDADKKAVAALPEIPTGYCGIAGKP